MTEAASPLGRGGGRTDDGVMRGRTDAEPTTVGILVVDDQAPFRSAARTLVRLVGGWRVVGEAVTGEEAVTMAAETHPDAVLMDINLPGIDGFEATRRILADRPETVVVLLSTYPADDLPQDPRSCGAVGYLRKEAVTPAALRALLAPSR
jgi:two-component system invasion response regulator UvrY